jgi:hypothetical protein
MVRTGGASLHLYIFDIDGTITQTKFARPHTPVNLADAVKIMDPWRVVQDKPRQAVIDWIQHIRLYAGSDTHIWLLTGRPEAARKLTEAWMQIHGVPYDRMVMLGEPTCTPTHEKKRQLLQELGAVYASILVVDDDPAVGTVVQTLGYGFVDAKEL